METIGKVSGHTNIATLVKSYDLQLEVSADPFLMDFCIFVFHLFLYFIRIRLLTPLQAPDLSNMMGALGQGPAVARGADFRPTKLVTRREVAREAAAASHPAGPSSAPGPSGAASIALAKSAPNMSTPPPPAHAPATLKTATKAPLRILKLSPAKFAEIKKAKMDTDAKAMAAAEKVPEPAAAAEKVPEPAAAAEKVPQPAAAVEKAPQPPIPATQFPFAQMMPMPGMPIPSKSDSEGQESSSTYTWQSCTMTTQRK